MQSDHLEGLNVHSRCSVGRDNRESEICSGGFFDEDDGVDATAIFACRCVVVRIRRTNKEDAGLCTKAALRPHQRCDQRYAASRKTRCPTLHIHIN